MELFLKKLTIFFSLIQNDKSYFFRLFTAAIESSPNVFGKTKKGLVAKTPFSPLLLKTVFATHSTRNLNKMSSTGNI